MTRAIALNLLQVLPTLAFSDEIIARFSSYVYLYKATVEVLKSKSLNNIGKFLFSISSRAA